MIIPIIQSIDTNVGFKSRMPYVHSSIHQTYKLLDTQFLEAAKSQGFKKGIILDFLNRIMLSPRSETYNITTIKALLQEKFDKAMFLLKEQKSAEEIAQKLSIKPDSSASFVYQYTLNERNKKILADYKRGIKIPELCKMYEMSNQLIRNILLKSGVDFKKVKDKKQEALIQMIENRFSDEAIALAMGVSKSTVSHKRLELGFKSKAPGKPEQKLYIVQKLLKEDYSRKEIAEEVGIALSSVNRFVIRLGWQKMLMRERDKKILDMADKNIPLKIIAERFGICLETVRRAIHRSRKNNLQG